MWSPLLGSPFPRAVEGKGERAQNLFPLLGLAGPGPSSTHSHRLHCSSPWQQPQGTVKSGGHRLHLDRATGDVKFNLAQVFVRSFLKRRNSVQVGKRQEAGSAECPPVWCVGVWDLPISETLPNGYAICIIKIAPSYLQSLKVVQTILSFKDVTCVNEAYGPAWDILRRKTGATSACGGWERPL